ncbi:MAG TPA: sigma-70 family RNA polymerase sigma factor [Chitinophagaceae bacterium]|nr:sigma-70 family RNA polymerase sigma factor [Chitinophagaceae bacterium]
MKKGVPEDMSDAALLAQFQSDKNSDWIGVLLQRYTLLLFGVCLKYLKDEEEAKDAVQQVFLKVLTEAGRHQVTYFKSWLYMVAKNYCLMQLRERPVKRVQALSENLPLPHEDLKKGELLESEAAFLTLEDALQALPPEQQQCIRLFYLQKQSYQQVSAATGYRLLQVKSYIQNGKRNLKAAIEKRGVRQGAK